MHRNIITIFFYIFTILLFLQISCHAAETDGFTDRCKPLEDSTSQLNDLVSVLLKKAIVKADRKTKFRYIRKNYPFRKKPGVDYCNKQDLTKAIRRLLARKLVGQVETYINRLPDNLSRKTSYNDSIYRNFPANMAPTLVASRRLGAVVNINGNLVGSDKFGHFFSEGWTSYKVAFSKPVPDYNKSLEYGIITESIYYGILTTGVFSHADLIANFNGMRFYNSINNIAEDPLGKEFEPSECISCVDGKWKLVKEFDWSEYIDAGWDEGINLSFFRNKELLDSVQTAISLNSSDFTENCLKNISEEEKQELNHKYRIFSKNLLNFQNHKILPEKLKPEYLLKNHSKISKLKQFLNNGR